MEAPSRYPWKPAWAAAALLLLFAAQLALTTVEESQTWDEGDHIFAGYRQWKSADFGLNPEHPPLVKLLAGAPLQFLHLWEPSLQDRQFKHEAFLDGRDFVARNGPDRILIPARLAAALPALLLAVLVFAAAREMFGAPAGLLALALVAFEPNLVAHGAKVTTDAAVTCFFFGAVYAFYRYAAAPSARRLALVGLAAGLALASKHTGVLVFPMLALVALYETARARHRLWRLAAALAVTGVLAVAILWAAYGFRYRARPDGLRMNPPLENYAAQLRPAERSLLLDLARARVLPQSYLYGLADVRSVSSHFPTYLFGKVHPNGVWWYFPAAFAIKSTAAFLILLAGASAVCALGLLKKRRELLYLAAPPAFYLLVALTAGLNIGVRHILPLYAFLSVLIAGAASALLARDRRWAVPLLILMLWHAASSLRSIPAQMAYANEFWGGPSQTYRYLSDSNTDWGQQLKHVRQYLERRGVTKCWFAYFAQGVADTAAYGIPCRPLPTADSIWIRQPIEAPPAIDGTVLVSAATLSGFETGPGPLNPYHTFQNAKPTAFIDHGVFVYDGHFEIPLAAALSHLLRSAELQRAAHPEAALAEARAAVSVCPTCIQAQAALGDLLAATGRKAEAQASYRNALSLADGLEREYRDEWIARLKILQNRDR